MERPKRLQPKRSDPMPRRSAPTARSSHLDATSAFLMSLQRQAGNRATTAFVQRRIQKNPPQYINRAKGLATTMLEGLTHTELGLTIPVLNGEHFIGPGVSRNEYGQPKRVHVKLPEIVGEDSKQGVDYVNQYGQKTLPVVNMSLFDDNYGKAQGEEVEQTTDLKDDEARKQYNEGRWLWWVPVEPDNVFDWRVELPQQGPWREDNVPKAKLVELVAEIGRRSQVAVPDAENLLTVEAGSLVVTDPAGDNALMTHTRQHENQHVGDHLGLVDEMFGPWDNYIREHGDKANAVKTNDSDKPSQRFNTANSYTPGADRIADEFGKQMMASGDDYHTTDEGSLPVITVASVTADTVTVHVQPRARLAGGNIPNARYRWGGTKISG